MINNSGDRCLDLDESDFVDADADVLAFLYASRTQSAEPSIQTPRTVSANVDYSREHIGNRLRALAELGLVERVGKGLYRLSVCGEVVVNGCECVEVVRSHLGECCLSGEETRECVFVP